MFHANRKISYFMHWVNKLLNAFNGELYCPFMEWTLGRSFHEMVIQSIAHFMKCAMLFSYNMYF